MTTARAELVGAVHRGQVLVIIGAGVSLDASGSRPEASWVGLLRSGLAHLETTGRHSNWAKGKLAELARESSDALGLSFLADELRERMNLATEGESEFSTWLKTAVERIEGGYKNLDAPKSLVEAVVGLKCPMATTNYDCILELHSGATSITLGQEDEVAAFLRNDRDAVLHLHGLPSQNGSVILGRQSYEEHLGNSVKIELQRALSTIYSCLFVGFGEGLRDLNFTPWFKWISSTLKASSIRHYVLLRESEAKLWDARHHNITAISYGSQHSDLPAFLQNLRTSADKLPNTEGAKPERGADLPGAAEQLLWKAINSRRDGKEEIARALHRFVSDKLLETRLTHYATKYRIKSLHSTWNKVQELAANCPDCDPTEIVDQVRDIIGIRIVTLYRLDLKHVVQEVAGWFSSPTLEAAAPFRAKLESVKIFGRDVATPENGSPLEIATALRRYFSDNSVPIEDGPAPVASSYSAFHLLCSYIDHNGRRSTFDIQLRSALEDIWSEIEHALRYKPIDKGIKRAARDAAELLLARYHLLSLKTLIDGAAQYADTIRFQLDQLAPDTRRLATYTLNKTDRLDALLSTSKSSRQFRERFTDLFKRQTTLLGKVVDPDKLQDEERAAVSADLTQLAKEYQVLRGVVETITLKQGFDRREVEVMVQMEEALCLLESAIRHPVKSERKPGLRPALAIYNKMRGVLESGDASPWCEPYVPVALFRLARLRWNMDQREDSIALSEKAYSIVIRDVKSDRLRHSGSRLYREIVHHLIWTLQDWAETIAMAATENGELDYRLEDRKHLYRRIVEVSLESLAMLDEKNEEFRNAALFGAAEYAALATPIWDAGVASEQHIRYLVEQFDILNVISSDDTDMVHTAFRTADLILRDRKLAEDAAKRLEFLISQVAVPDEYQVRDLAQARGWLARNGASNGGEVGPRSLDRSRRETDSGEL